MTRGSCLCGAVHFQVTGPMRSAVACHCNQCRKVTGHYFAATSAPTGAIAITGDVTWFQSSQTARRGFCGACGSNLFWDGPGENIAIAMGALDGATGLSLIGHIYCADKGDYYEITDDLPQAAERDPRLTTVVT